MTAKARLPVFFAALLGLFATVRAEEKKEVLIYEGPEFTTPGLGPKEELTFIKQFLVDESVWARQPRLAFHSEKLPLSAEKAIELAKASADAGDGPGEKNLTRLELLRHGGAAEEGREGIYYYLVELNVEGSEVHRVVLMDGTVVKSSLKEVKQK